MIGFKKKKRKFSKTSLYLNKEDVYIIFFDHFLERKLPFLYKKIYQEAGVTRHDPR